MAKREDVKYLGLHNNYALWREVMIKPSRCVDVNELFIWSCTKEGHDYWYKVHLGCVPFEEYQEKLFRIAQYSEKLTVALSDLFFTVDEKDLWE